MPAQAELRRIMITHADEPLGRRLVKRLYHDAKVSSILAVGEGPPPRAFDQFLRNSGGHLSYQRLDLTKHRPVNDLFHSGPVRQSGIDTVIHVPSHARPVVQRRPALADVPDRIAEARLVLQHCLEVGPIRHVIALSSAYVYKLANGNANRFTESSELYLEADLPAETRAWVDCDMLFHAEVNNEGLHVAVLRIPTVVGTGGALFMNPSLMGGPSQSIRALGFDPMCALVADKDVARAVGLALHRNATGIFNISGRESLPLSVLARWSGGTSLPVPGILLQGAASAAHALGAESWRNSLDGPHMRYGFTLDTRRAERELGFRPGYRIGLGRADDGRPRIESSLS